MAEEDVLEKQITADLLCHPMYNLEEAKLNKNKQPNKTSHLYYHTFIMILILCESKLPYHFCASKHWQQVVLQH